MRKRVQAILAALAVSLCGSAAAASDIKTISGTATYVGERTDSPAEVRRKAVEAARIRALASEFGTVLSQTVESRESNAGGHEESYFSSLTSSEVRGEWIADAGEPEISASLDADGNYVCTARVSIRARALSNKAVPFEAAVLRNGRDPRHADTRFRAGDDMYVSFRAPADGYLAIYLAVDDHTVMNLLPYLSSVDNVATVRRNRDYIFFDPANAEPALGTPDELCMQTEEAVEYNRLYVVFSPNRFNKAQDRHSGDGSMPRVLSKPAFDKWLTSVRRRDDEASVKVMNLTITNQ